jgi:hypothetical protein
MNVIQVLKGQEPQLNVNITESSLQEETFEPMGSRGNPIVSLLAMYKECMEMGAVYNLTSYSEGRRKHHTAVVSNLWSSGRIWPSQPSYAARHMIWEISHARRGKKCSAAEKNVDINK